jgi:hypothetical protein
MVRSGTDSREVIWMFTTGGKRGVHVFEDGESGSASGFSEMEITDDHVTRTRTRLAGWNTERIGAKRKLINS